MEEEKQNQQTEKQETSQTWEEWVADFKKSGKFVRDYRDDFAAGRLLGFEKWPQESLALFRRFLDREVEKEAMESGDNPLPEKFQRSSEWDSWYDLELKIMNISREDYVDYFEKNLKSFWGAITSKDQENFIRKLVYDKLNEEIEQKAKEQEKEKSKERMQELCKEYHEDFQKPGTVYGLETKVMFGKTLNGHKSQNDALNNYYGKNGKHYFDKDDSITMALLGNTISDELFDYRHENYGDIFLVFHPLKKDGDIWELCINMSTAPDVHQTDSRPCGINLNIRMRKDLGERILEEIGENPENWQMFLETVVPGISEACAPSGDCSMEGTRNSRKIFIYKGKRSGLKNVNEGKSYKTEYNWIKIAQFNNSNK